MNTEPNDDLVLTRAPIIEAVLDLDCDLPPGQQLPALEQPARERFTDRYPKMRVQHFQGYQIEQPPDGEARFSAKRATQAFQFLTDDEAQLIQVRAQGYSFNRLAPYSTLDHYLAEVRRTWELYCEIASPLVVRAVRLRYINRIRIPLTNGDLKLNDYLTAGPRLPDNLRMRLAGFLNQHQAIEEGTENRVSIVLATQGSEDDAVFVILDITAFRETSIDPIDWDQIGAIVQSLRALKNIVFRRSLTEKCMELFR
jgi:uncharacterized protein (TIGR04255 family)